MSNVLLFNLHGEKREKILFLLIRLGIACREVSPAEQGKTIGALTEKETKGVPAQRAASKAPFPDEMLVMDGLDAGQFHGLLDGLRRNHVPVALKAVVTEQNLSWTAAELHEALLEEHIRLSQNRS